MATRIEFHQHGGPDVLQALEFTPKDPAEHEIQVENKAIGINYIDTYIRSGLYPPPVIAERSGYRSRWRSKQSRQRRETYQSRRSGGLRAIGAGSL